MDERDFFENTPLHLAVLKKDLEGVRKLLMLNPEYVDSLNQDHNTPLHLATMLKSTDILRELLIYGADINAVNAYQRTPLMMATISKAKRNLDFVQELIDHGANVNLQINGTPLSIAAKEGNIAFVEMLVAAGADVNIGERNGKSPLFLAIENGHYDIAQFLLENGASALQKDNRGFLPIDLCGKYQMIGILQSYMNAEESVKEPQDE